MNWDLWRSHGRIFAYRTCLYFSLCLSVAIFCPAFVSYNLKNPNSPKHLFFFVLKTRFFSALLWRIHLPD